MTRKGEANEPTAAGSVLLSSGGYAEFDDFANLMRVIEHVRLGDGKKAERLLDIVGAPTGKRVKVGAEGSTLTFEDIELRRFSK